MGDYPHARDWLAVRQGLERQGGRQELWAERRDELAFWILMLVCTVVNSSFGVLMEGPVLGIWFWFALGFASARSLRSGVEFPSRLPVREQLRRHVVSGLYQRQLQP